MRMLTRGCHIMVPETNQITNFQARFFYNTFYVLLVNKSTYRYNIFYGPVFFRRVKRTNETTILQVRFFYNTFLYSLTNSPIIVTLFY